MTNLQKAAEEMTAAINQAGIFPLEDVTTRLAFFAGTFIRFRCEGDRRGKRNGYAVLFPDGQAGAFGHWPTQVKVSWRSKGRYAIWQPQDMRAISYRLAAQREARSESERSVSAKAENLLKDAGPASRLHPYLLKKGLPAIGLYQRGETLLAPVTDIFGKIWSLQRILSDGTKLFLPGRRRPRTFWSTGLKLADDIGAHPECIYIGEGVATMLALHIATGYSPVVAAMEAHSLVDCARAIRTRFPKSTLIICADDDAATQLRLGRNPGIEAANAAAAAVNGLVLQPQRRAK